jgi:general stress protein 26
MLLPFKGFHVARLASLRPDCSRPRRNKAKASPFSAGENNKGENPMASLTEAREAPERQLWDEIGKIHAGMLGIQGSQMHFQPMSPNVDRKTSTIWFFTKTDTDLVQSIGTGSRAHFCVVGKDQDYHACLSGRIEVRADREKIDEYWSAVTAAWYEHGKDDPLLTMLALRVDDAKIWASTDSTLKFGWEIAKANLNDEKIPEVGVQQHLSFPQY